MRFAGAGRPLELETVPDPEPGPGWVVVDIEAAGLCHSDLHIMSGMDLGDLTVKSPVTLGHEGAGVISAVGDGVQELRGGRPGRASPWSRTRSKRPASHPAWDTTERSPSRNWPMCPRWCASPTT